MSVAGRLVSFAVGLVLVFGASYVVAGAVVPDRVVEDWTRSAEQSGQHDDPSAPHSGRDSGQERSGRATTSSTTTPTSVVGDTGSHAHPDGAP